MTRRLSSALPAAARLEDVLNQFRLVEKIRRSHEHWITVGLAEVSASRTKGTMLYSTAVTR